MATNTTTALKSRAKNTQKFANALLAGKTVTAKQAKRLYRVPNPSATVFHLREAGFNIKTGINGKYFI